MIQRPVHLFAALFVGALVPATALAGSGDRSDCDTCYGSMEADADAAPHSDDDDDVEVDAFDLDWDDGYGAEADPEAAQTKLLGLWARFYQLERFPSYEEVRAEVAAAAAAGTESRYFELRFVRHGDVSKPKYFDSRVYKQRLAVVLSAAGVGATITASRDMSVIDFGEHFSSRIVWRAPKTAMTTRQHSWLQPMTSTATGSQTQRMPMQIMMATDNEENQSDADQHYIWGRED